MKGRKTKKPNNGVVSSRPLHMPVVALLFEQARVIFSSCRPPKTWGEHELRFLLRVSVNPGILKAATISVDRQGMTWNESDAVASSKNLRQHVARRNQDNAIRF